MKKEFLNFIGTGSCFNTEFGNNSAYYFDEVANSLLVIDCGEDVFSKLRRTDLLAWVFVVVSRVCGFLRICFGSLDVCDFLREDVKKQPSFFCFLMTVFRSVFFLFSIFSAWKTEWWLNGEVEFILVPYFKLNIIF